MSREKNLVKNTAILSLGTFFPKLVALIVIPILTAQLTKAEYGQYDLITTLVSLLLPAVTLQISSAAFRFLIDKRNDKTECCTIITNIFIFVVPMSLLTSVIYYFISAKNLGFAGVLVCLYFISDILLLSAQQVMRGMSLNMLYSVSSIIRSLVDMVLVVVLLGALGTSNYGLTGVLLAMTISTLVAFLFILYKGKIYAYFNISYISKECLRELLQYSWPMVPNNLSGWVLRLSDRLVITAVLGIEANAVYAVANKLPNIFGAVQNTFIYAWQENASIASKDEDKDVYYSQMFDGVFEILEGLMAGLIMLTPILFKVLIKGDYRKAYYQMPAIYMGMMFSCMSSVIGGIYVAFKKTKSVGITTICAAIINLLIDILSIRIIGIWAGSISTMVAYLALLTYRMYDVQKFQRISFKLHKIVFGIGLLTLMAVLSYQKIWILDFANVILFLMIIALFDRSIIRTFFVMFREKLKREK